MEIKEKIQQLSTKLDILLLGKDLRQENLSMQKGKAKEDDNMSENH